MLTLYPKSIHLGTILGAEQSFLSFLFFFFSSLWPCFFSFTIQVPLFLALAWTRSSWPGGEMSLGKGTELPAPFTQPSPSSFSPRLVLIYLVFWPFSVVVAEA